MDKDLQILLDKLPPAVKDFYISNNNVTEIRIRKNSNIVMVSSGINHLLGNTTITEKELEDIFLSLCDYTISAYEDQMAEGFITLSGGHRIGIAGRFTKDNDGKILISQLFSLNIRLSCLHTIKIPDNIMDFTKGLLICGKPHSGKTTFIRNICLHLNGDNYTVCDERNEIYHSCLNGDFIINLPKSVAIMQAVRVLNPSVIICDEIGNKEETEKMLEYMNSGVKFVCSVHCTDFSELRHKPNISSLISAGVFDKFVLLDNFVVKEIIDV